MQEDELTTSQTEPSVSLKSVKPPSSPTNNTTTWTIGHEQDKKENTPNKSSLETVVQDAEGDILIKVKKGEHYDHMLETHLKKEEVLGVQPTLQSQFKEKHNIPMFEPLVHKDSNLRTSRRQILDESGNPGKLPDFINLSYP